MGQITQEIKDDIIRRKLNGETNKHIATALDIKYPVVNGIIQAARKTCKLPDPYLKRKPRLELNKRDIYEPCYRQITKQEFEFYLAEIMELRTNGMWQDAGGWAIRRELGLSPDWTDEVLSHIRAGVKVEYTTDDKGYLIEVRSEYDDKTESGRKKKTDKGLESTGGKPQRHSRASGR